jgi:glycosyltransferase involved in cell wall biosynthesis
MLLSIIIPCRGRQEKLNILLSQIVSQSRERNDIEIIVVDDGTHPPLNINYEDRVKVLRHEFGQGAPAAREFGLSSTSGKYVHFHDSDDLLGHEWLGRTLASIQQVPPPDLIVTSRLVVEADGTVAFWSVRRVADVAKTPTHLRSYQRFINRIGPLGGVTFSRKAAEAITFHRSSASQDWLMYDGALAAGDAVYFDLMNYFIQKKTNDIRISNNARLRARGYIFAANTRFSSPRMRRLAARLYCVHGATVLSPIVDVRYRWLKRMMCEILARGYLSYWTK